MDPPRAPDRDEIGDVDREFFVVRLRDPNDSRTKREIRHNIRNHPNKKLRTFFLRLTMRTLYETSFSRNRPLREISRRGVVKTT